MATETQYTVKVPLNPTGFPSTDKVVIWDTSEGMFNITEGDSQCTRWVYNSTTTPSGISAGQVRFNNSDITGATEIYISVDATSGSNNWNNYFNKLVKTLCCTLTVRKPNDPNNYITYDYDTENSTLESGYLKFVVSSVWSAPLINDDDFTVNRDGDELCLDFDLFRCDNTNTASGTGDTVNEACFEFWQYASTSIGSVTEVGDPDINTTNLNDNGGNGQFTIGLTGGTTAPYTLVTGDTVYVKMSKTNYWADQTNALNIDVQNSVRFTQWNNNGTSTTGEFITIDTTSIVESTDYIVFGGNISSITDGLTSGLTNNSFYCISIKDITRPTTDNSSCGGHKFRMGHFSSSGEFLTASNTYQFDGIEISNGDAIGDFGGGGILINGIYSSGNGGYGLCPPYNEKFFLFSDTDYEGNSTSSFIGGLVVGDKFKYECVYNDNVNNANDYIVAQVVQNPTTFNDVSGNTVYSIKTIILNDESNINLCSSFFNRPNNLICVSDVTNILTINFDPGKDEIVYNVEKIGDRLSPDTTGSTTFYYSDITNLSGTPLYVTYTDLNEVDNQNIFDNVISYITLNYRGCSITYEVDSQTSNTGVSPPYELLGIGSVVTNGFSSPRGVKYSASTIVTGETISMVFNSGAGDVVLNAGTNRIITSNGKANQVEAQPNLLFDGNTLELTGDTKFEGDRYEQSANVVASTIGYNIIHSIPTASGTSVYFHYVVKERTNGYMRSGTVMTVNDGTNSSYTDVSTPDIVGSTKDIQFSAIINGSDLRLRVNVISGDWNVKVRTEVIFT